MLELNQDALFRSLHPLPLRKLEAALGACVNSRHVELEVEHWLKQLVDAADCDVAAVLRRYGVDSSRVTEDLAARLDRMAKGRAADRPPALSRDLRYLMQSAWLLASVNYGASRVRSGHLLLALLVDDAIARPCKAFDKIPTEELTRDLLKVVAGTAEDSGPPPAEPREDGGVGKPAATSSPNLDQFTVDLTARARAGKFDPVRGRDHEIRQVVDVLMRRRKNNPILTGEAGVGKTAVVEGLAQQIASGEAPPELRNVVIRTLDLGMLQAGASMKGEFENRVNGVLREVAASPQPVILFIDEAHQLVGAGGQAGQGDAANLLKPALARGELRTIAATTFAEYKKHIATDPALARRFEEVKVEEPSDEVAVEMMRGLAKSFEAHHKVAVRDEALHESVRLSRRYLHGRQLPDKSVGVLDTACARVRLSQTTTPPDLEDARRRAESARVTLDVLRREQESGLDHAAQIDVLEGRLAAAEADAARLETRLGEERELVRRIHEAEAKLTASAQAERAPVREDLRRLDAELVRLQAGAPLIHARVDAQSVADVVGGWTGLPLGRMLGDEVRAVLQIKERLEKRVVGQPHALDAVAKAIRTSRAGLADPCKPIGVFLMVGMSGTGKTETAVSLAEEIYGGEQNMTVFNMSEFKEEHRVAVLMGPPPGYVGHGEGGVLTEAVRRKPYSVILLDEMEKAHPALQDVFFQVFDKGSMRDGNGDLFDFRNTVIVMTSNAATDAIKNLCADKETAPDAEGLAESLQGELQKTFKPAFLGRVAVVPYFPLGDDVLLRIVDLKLGKVAKRFEETYKCRLEFDPAVSAAIRDRCREVDSGARNIDKILSHSLLPDLSSALLSRVASGAKIRGAKVRLTQNGAFECAVDAAD